MQRDQADCLLHLPPEDFFIEVSLRLSSYAIIFEPKPKSYFKVIQLVEDEIEGRYPDWCRIRKVISSCKSLEFQALVNEANVRKQEGDWRNFHRIVKSILGIRKNSASVRKLDEPSEPG